MLARFLIVATFSLWSGGCVTAAGNRLKDVERMAPAAVPRVEQTIGDYSFHLDGGKMITSIKAGRLLNDEILSRWKKWGYVASQTYVKESGFSGSADYEVTLGGFQDGDSSVLLQIVSGLTLVVIPYYVNTNFTVKYDVRDPRTDQVWHAEVEESYNAVISLLLMPISPFAQGGRTKTFDRIAANLYQQLRSQGAFERPPASMASPSSIRAGQM